MSEQDIRQLYRQGEDAVVTFVLSLLKELDQLKDNDQGIDQDPATPSGMQPVYAKSSIKRRKSRPGRKKGHKGSRRQKPSHIDKHQEHELCNCPDCQNPDIKQVDTRTRYIERIVPQQTEVTEHTINRYWCGCCKKIVEAKVTDALPGSTIHIHTLVLAAWLHYGLGITLEKILQILNKFSQMQVSKGGLIQAWHQLAGILKPIYDDIGKQALKSAVLHIDETGWRVLGKTYWLWCFANHNLVYFVIDRSRGSPVIKKVLGKLFNGILISDFFGAYNSIVAFAKQKCLCHIFTDLARTEARNQSDEWKRFAKKLKRFLKDAIRLHKNINELSEEKLARRINRLHDRLKEIYRHNYQDKDAKRLAKRLKRHQDEILTFLHHPEISADNNFVERELRPAIVSRKNSFCNRSEKGAGTQAIFMTLFRTSYIRKQNAVDSLTNIAQHYLKYSDTSNWENMCTSDD